MMAMSMAISEIARRAGFEPSAIRYYEHIGILPTPQRSGGKRRYDESVLVKLALIQRARRSGFSLEEIRRLFLGFREGTPASMRWQKLSQKKVREIEGMICELSAMKRLILKMVKCCRCVTLDQCGRGILASSPHPAVAPLFVHSRRTPKSARRARS